MFLKQRNISLGHHVLGKITHPAIAAAALVTFVLILMDIHINRAMLRLTSEPLNLIHTKRD